MTEFDMVLKHCAVLRASLTQQQVGLELLASQLTVLETYARQCREQADQPTAVIVLPDTCQGHPEQDCARQSEEGWIVGRDDWAPMCRGCGLNPHQPVS